MPERIDRKLLRKPVLLTDAAVPQLVRASPAAPPPGGELEALQARANLGAALLARADAERSAVLSQAIRGLGITSPPPLQLLAAKLGAPGSTVQLGLDFPGQTINAFRAQQVYRSPSGAGSYIRLTSGDQRAGFHLDLEPSACEGIYLAVVHAAGNAAQLDVRIFLYPNNGLSLTVPRSADKFLVPFEVRFYAYLASIEVGIPAGVGGDLEILRIDVTKVT